MEDQFDGIAIVDRLKVMDRIARYSWAIDSGDLETYLDCFDARGTLHHPRPDGTPGAWSGHDGITAFVEKGFTNRATQAFGHQHQISAVRMSVRADDIQVDAYAAIFRHDFHRQYWPRGATWRLGTWHGLFRRAGADWKILDLDIRMWTDTAFGTGQALVDRGPGLPGTKD